MVCRNKLDFVAPGEKKMEEARKNVVLSGFN
jgi:hypothetical protein